MEKSYSIEVKALLTLDNFLDAPQSVLRDNCILVTHIDYSCEFRRNDSNAVYGAVDPVIMNFSIRIGSEKKAEPFYRYLVENGHNIFTFLYNTTFDKNDRIDTFYDGMIVDAFVVKVEQDYTTQRTGRDSDEQIMLRVKLLVRSITYLGKDKNFTSSFIQ
jgi:hypothetical protein